MSIAKRDRAAHCAALFNTLPTSIEGVRLSAQLSACVQTPTLRELDDALSIAWIAASRLVVEQNNNLDDHAAEDAAAR